MTDPEESSLSVTEQELHDGLVHRVQRRIELIESELGSRIQTAMVPELVQFRKEITEYAAAAFEQLREDVTKLIADRFAELSNSDKHADSDTPAVTP